MGTARSPRSKMVYVPELDAMVQENLVPDLFYNFDEGHAKGRQGFILGAPGSGKTMAAQQQISEVVQKMEKGK